jgi:hypothetical protein
MVPCGAAAILLRGGALSKRRGGAPHNCVAGRHSGAALGLA